MKAMTDRDKPHPKPNPNPKVSAYLQAGSPLSCFLPSCRKPFIGTCVHGKDGHFYCSGPCADEGERMDFSHVQDIRRGRI